jgi:hypothetical protein
MSLLASFGYSQQVILFDDPGLVFYFPLDEGAGDTIKDMSPNKIEGELENSPNWVNGQVGGALEFKDGKEQGAFIPNQPALDLGTDNVTLAAWFKTPKSTGQGFIFIKWDGGGWYIKIQDNKLASRFNVPGVGGDTVPSNKDVADNQWHHIAAMRVNQTDVIVYLDGKIDAKAPGASPEGSVESPANLEIGRWKEERYWDGVFDELLLIRTNLNLAEVKLLMEGQLLSVGSKGKLPVAWGRIKAARY